MEDIDSLEERAREFREKYLAKERERQDAVFDKVCEMFIGRVPKDLMDEIRASREALLACQDPTRPGGRQPA